MMICFILAFVFVLSVWILVLKLVFNKIMKDCLFDNFLESNHFARFEAEIRIIIHDVILDIINGRFPSLESTCSKERVEKKSYIYEEPALETQRAFPFPLTEFVSSPPKEEIGATSEMAAGMRRRSLRRRENQDPVIRLRARHN